MNIRHRPTYHLFLNINRTVPDLTIFHDGNRNTFTCIVDIQCIHTLDDYHPTSRVCKSNESNNNVSIVIMNN